MTILNPRTIAAAVVLTAAGLVAAGCGSPAAGQVLKETPGNKVVQEAIGNTLASPQFSFKGELDGEASGQLGVTYSEKDGTCEDRYGVINLAGVLTQGTTTVIVGGQTVWIRFDDSYFRAHYSPSAAAGKIASLKGRWLRYPAASPVLQPDVQLCDLRKQWRHWPDGFAGIKGKVTTYGGQRVYQLVLGSGAETIDVTDSTTPKLVHVEMATSETSRLDYDYDYSPVTLRTPAASQSVPGRT